MTRSRPLSVVFLAVLIASCSSDSVTEGASAGDLDAGPSIPATVPVVEKGVLGAPVATATYIPAEPTGEHERYEDPAATVGRSSPEWFHPIQSPIDAHFGILPEGEAELFALAQVESQAAHMDVCMRANGFDWYREPRENNGRSTSELVYYGVSTSLRLSVVGDSTVHAEYEQLRAREAEMAEAEKEEFESSWRQCFEQATELFPLRHDLDISDELRQEIAAALDEIAHDPGFDLIWQDWASCMREFGVDGVSNRDDLVARMHQMGESIGDRILARTLNGSPPDPEQSATLLADIDELEEREIEMWTLDQRCTTEHEIDQRVRSLRFELETNVLTERGDRWNLMRNHTD